uniref:Transposase MuDR plant domain-containing protein n=1 Tax=Solanum lycopersicum TaxID=4081 RepID=A0A3Q7G1B2_SOLLC
MLDEVEIVFNYGGSWVISPLLAYTKKLVHSWLNFDPELLSHKDICDEFTSKLGFSRVKQLLTTGPSEKYYIVDGNDGIRAILSLLCEKFKVVNFFVVEEGEFTVVAQNITQYVESCCVDVEVGTDCEHSPGSVDEWDLSEGEECDLEWMDAISNERGRVVGDRLESFKELQVGMTFKDMKEGRQVMNYYALANKRALTIIKGDTKRTRYGCDIGCPFRCLISKDGKTEGFKIKTFINKHTCEETFFNARADAVTLAQYFKNKLQNNPKYKVKDMRGQLENDLKLNVCQSKLKRAKRMALEKLDGSFIDDYNKLEAYAQELKQSNPGSDGLIDAVVKVLPEAQHRYCVRHIESNWCRKWRSGQMRKLMWWCAWSSYVEEFKDQLNKLGKLSKDGARNLVKYPPKAWCRAYFDTQCKNMMVDNNFTESFNAWILEARAKPIIKMLEEIRVQEKCAENNAHSKKGKRPMSNNEHGSDVEGGIEAETGTEAVTQEFEPYGPNVEDEEDPPLRPMVICESELRAEKLKKRVVPTGARKIQFYGDHTGASVPTNLPYSPIKTTWKGKEAVPAGHVQMQAKKKRIKMMGVKGRNPVVDDLL